VSGVVIGDDGVARCGWATGSSDYEAYHDQEWGRAVHDDRRLFEKLSLEAFQSGLSWLTILRKRPAFREVFHDFDIASIAAFGETDVARLLDDARIVRNRAKITAVIVNARAARALIADVGSFDTFLWRFAPQTPGPPPRVLGDVAPTSPESTAMAKALKSRGFRFVGPTTCYALMQAVGMVNDHLVDCAFRVPHRDVVPDGSAAS
jgi:DNA-3-methyladenine glycosylase I